jgi:hypothetical protein
LQKNVSKAIAVRTQDGERHVIRDVVK